MKSKDMVAVVAGAAGGTGPAVVDALRRECQAVVGVVRGDDVTWREVGSGEYEATADLLKQTVVARLVSEIRRHLDTFHVWINLVGGFFSGSVIEETDWEDWSRMLDLNFRPVLNCCREILPLFKSQGFGRIINFGSVPGLEGMARGGPYALSKAAVISLTRTVAVEGRDDDVTANVLIPTIIDTPSNRKAMPRADFSEWIKPEAVAREILSVIGSSRSGDVIRL
ncbi:MAG: SDR family NAD(P)-dependent oxidoreductase [Fidelibacterota bacterium]